MIEAFPGGRSWQWTFIVFLAPRVVKDVHSGTILSCMDAFSKTSLPVRIEIMRSKRNAVCRTSYYINKYYDMNYYVSEGGCHVRRVRLSTNMKSLSALRRCRLSRDFSCRSCLPSRKRAYVTMRFLHFVSGQNNVQLTGTIYTETYKSTRKNLTSHSRRTIVVYISDVILTNFY